VLSPIEAVIRAQKDLVERGGAREVTLRGAASELGVVGVSTLASEELEPFPPDLSELEVGQPARQVEREVIDADLRMHARTHDASP
jgi:hypothetical protein